MGTDLKCRMGIGVKTAEGPHDLAEAALTDVRRGVDSFPRRSPSYGFASFKATGFTTSLDEFGRGDAFPKPLVFFSGSLRLRGGTVA